MNTYEIVRKAVAALWPYPDLGHMTATEVNKRESCNEMAILVAITEATDQLQKENEELAFQIEKATPFIHKLQSQLSTTRESALREAIDKIEWRIKVLAFGCDKTYETAIHELRQRIEDIQSLITTPATCEWTCLAEGWHKNPHTQHPVFALNLKATPFCPYCGKPIAQVNGVVEREKSKAVATCGKCYHGIPFDRSCAECNAVIHPMQTDRNPRGA